MHTNVTYFKHLKYAKTMLAEGHSRQDIELALNREGAEEATVKEIMGHLKPEEKSGRTQKGSLLVLCGVVLLGIGFIFSILFVGSGTSINFALYGLTILGAVVLIAGLAMVFH